MYNIVTSATPSYLPGVEALRNSLRMEFPEAKLHCFYYDQGTNVPLPEGVEYIINAPMPGPIFQEGVRLRLYTPIGPDMYARLLIPNYFEGRAFYVDADCVVLDSLKELWEIDLQGLPSACCFRPDIGWSGGNRYDDMGSGTLLVDCDVWKEQEIVDKCFDLMRKVEEENLKVKWHLNVESVLSWFHNGRFYHLEPEYQFLAYYAGLYKEVKVIHYASDQKPWKVNPKLKETPQPNYKQLWLGYYHNDKEVVNEFKAQLQPKKAFFSPKRREDIRFG